MNALLLLLLPAVRLLCSFFFLAIFLRFFRSVRAADLQCFSCVQCERTRESGAKESSHHGKNIHFYCQKVNLLEVFIKTITTIPLHDLYNNVSYRTPNLTGAFRITAVKSVNCVGKVGNVCRSCRFA